MRWRMFGVAALTLSFVAAPSVRFFGKPAAALAPQAPAAVPVSAGMSGIPSGAARDPTLQSF
jgi:hypothetical protein